MAKASDNPFPSLLVVEGAAPAAPAAGRHRLFVDTADSHLKRVDEAGTVTDIEATGGGGGGGVVQSSIRYTSGVITMNSTSWANLPGIGTVSLAGVSAGDVIWTGMTARTQNEAVVVVLDIVTEVSGSPVNSCGYGGPALTGAAAGAAPVRAWAGASGSETPITGILPYTLQAGDISAGTVTLRIRYRTSAATNKTIWTSATEAIHFFAWKM